VTIRKPSRANESREKAQRDAYFAALAPAARRRLRKLRSIIRQAAPDAVESFSYRMPGFRLDGRPLVWYAAFKVHYSLFPITAAIQRAFSDALEGYETSTGTVRFPMTHEPPAGLVQKLVEARIAEVRRPARR
jgi:uncharacterized protein YdhG (YjbR/CyaY superfamily)